MEVLDTEGFKKKIFNFEAQKDWAFQGEIPAIIDFYADWCGPCRALAPVLEELSEEYAGKIQIYKIDTEASPELAALFEIRSIPSLLFVPQKGEPSMVTGAIPKDSFYLAIKDLFSIAKPSIQP